MSLNPDEWIVRDPVTLGRAIAHFRSVAQLSQGELAQRSALHRSYLSELERGKATEQTERLFRVLRRLRLELVVRPSRS